MNKPAKKFAEGNHLFIQIKDFKITVMTMKTKKAIKKNRKMMKSKLLMLMMKT